MATYSNGISIFRNVSNQNSVTTASDEFAICQISVTNGDANPSIYYRIDGTNYHSATSGVAPLTIYLGPGQTLDNLDDNPTGTTKVNAVVFKNAA